jgi:hypothetical protein
MRSFRGEKRILIALLAGIITGVAAAGVHLTTMPVLDREFLVPEILGDVVAGLLTIVVCLAIQLKQEEVHYRAAMERVAIIAEVNHHVRNAVFPLCLAAQKTGDPQSIRIASDAVDKINLALKDATTDALSRRIEYGETTQPVGRARAA